MPKYVKRPVVVEAVQLTREIVVNSPEGSITGRVGDWLVTGTEGEQYVVQKHIFPNIYDGPIDQPTTIEPVPPTI